MTELRAKCGCTSLHGTVIEMCDVHVIHMHNNQFVSFTGHRPDKLGTGYSITNDKVKEYSEVLTPILEELIADGYKGFITGGAIGFDQIAYWTVHKLKKKYTDIQNIVAVPFREQASVWKGKELVRYYDLMLKSADKIILVDELPDTNYQTSTPSGKYSAQKMQKRNEFMVDHSDVVVACFDGTSGGTANCVRYADDCGKRVIEIKPF